MTNTAPKTFTVPQVARKIGVSEQRIRWLCEELKLGVKLNASLRLLTQPDVAKLRKRCTGTPGRPKSKVRKG
jgi:hypothetical protein